MSYTRKMKRFLAELRGMVNAVPPETQMAHFIVEHPEEGKRLVWLLVATGQQVTDRLLFHFGWDHPQQIRDEAWGTKFWPDHMVTGDRLYERWLEKQTCS